MITRKLNPLDKLLNEVDQALRVVHTKAPTTGRVNPSQLIDNNLTEVTLSDSEKKLSARLMRINHAGEVAAQGLYRGQALMSKSDEIREQMKNSAAEENDHLNWCEIRLEQLDSHKSYLSPVWYLGSFGIGAVAGFAGDKWSLGFVKETEDQVGKHINSHLNKLPEKDNASRAILEQMKTDEAHHAEVAVEAGAVELPFPVRKILMPLISKIMTTFSAKI
ncbi:MAG: ubiquinone biosynthesis monooxygenase Coq7 [Cocleimonas sp.]|jgi:ubiquinone biosynthesis monooxygenase Coq7